MLLELNKTAASPKFESRPWGTYTVLDEGANFKVKRIEVIPEKRLSYQEALFAFGALASDRRHCPGNIK